MVAILSAILIGIGWTLYLFNPETHALYLRYLGERAGQKLIFLSYFSVLFSMWLVYFLSGTGLRIFQVNTLRRLLMLTSSQWSDEELGAKSEEGFIAVTREKAVASIGMFAMLTAGAAVLMTRYIDRLVALKASHSELYSENALFEAAILYAASATSIIALICFIIAVDSMDVLFNRFGNQPGPARVHVVRYVYRSTRNIRYYGIMFFIWSICLGIGYEDTLLGSITVAVVVAAGWKHWFPFPDLPNLPENTELDQATLEACRSDPKAEHVLAVKTVFVLSSIALPLLFA